VFVSRVFVILTSKPGQFTTELGEEMELVEEYDYVFCGRRRAHFVIAKLVGEVKVKIVDASTPPVTNHVPSKFLPKFDTVEKARLELEQLARGSDTQLLRR
jgi:hypothetical protein